MQIKRLFSNEKSKGTRNYLNSQKKYEILRTLIYFGISFGLFVGGWIATGVKANMLTVVAILGCLPASKSAVSMILFLRYKSCCESVSQEIARHMENHSGLYDLVFTSNERNYQVSHIVVKGNTICGYSENRNFREQDFYKHIEGILKADRFNQTSIKIFTDLKKYTARLDLLKALETDETNTEGILATLKSVTL